MPFSMFYDLFPEVAELETRTANVLGEQTGSLPPGAYGFLEMYCDEPGCDCRRVLFSVLSQSQERIEAVIAWGWEDKEFYRKWSQEADPSLDLIEMLKGPCLNPGSPETGLAPALLDFVRDILLKDPAYVERIKRHYRMFREKIDNPPKQEWWRKKRRSR